MRRRDFLSVIAGATAWPLTAPAQQPAMPVIGFPNISTPEVVAPLLARFRQGLSETGYVERKNLAIEYRYGNFRPELLPQALDDLIRLNVNAIFAVTPEVVAVTKNATSTIPV